MFRRKPLIDADWLLGPAIDLQPSSQESSRSISLFPVVVTTTFAAGVFLFWNQLSNSFVAQLNGNTPASLATAATTLPANDPQIAAIVKLQEQLPNSIPELLTVVATHTRQDCALLAFKMLDSFANNGSNVAGGAGDLDLCLEQLQMPMIGLNAGLLCKLIERRRELIERNIVPTAEQDRQRLLNRYEQLLASASHTNEKLDSNPSSIRFGSTSDVAAQTNSPRKSSEDTGEKARIRFNAKASSDPGSIVQRHAKAGRRKEFAISQLNNANIHIVDRTPTDEISANGTQAVGNSLRSSGAEERLHFRLPAIHELVADSSPLTFEPDFFAVMSDAAPALPESLLQPMIRTIENNGEDSQSESLQVSQVTSGQLKGDSPRTIRHNDDPNRTAGTIRTVAYASTATNDELDDLGADEVENPRATALVEDKAERQAIAGLREMPSGDLIRLLGSVQPKIAGAAMSELQRRGMSEELLQTAVSLTVGTSQERINALEKLVGDQTYYPMPWLSLMAEDSDLKVREHSIKLLGSIASDDARRQLRLLLNRETNGHLQNLIRQLSLASGSTRPAR